MTVTRQRRGCDFNLGASVPEFSTTALDIWSKEKLID